MHNINKIKTLQRDYENACKKLGKAVAKEIKDFVSIQGKGNEKNIRTLVIAKELNDFVDIPYILSEAPHSDALEYEMLKSIRVQRSKGKQKLIFETESDHVSESLVSAPEWNELLHFFEELFKLFEDGVVIVHGGTIRLLYGSEYEQ